MIELQKIDSIQGVTATAGLGTSQARKSPKGENLLSSLVSDVVQCNISNTYNNNLSEVSESISEKVHFEIVQYHSEKLTKLDYKMLIHYYNGVLF